MMTFLFFNEYKRKQRKKEHVYTFNCISIQKCIKKNNIHDDFMFCKYMMNIYDELIIII